MKMMPSNVAAGSAVVAVNRVSEMEAFDALPASLQRAMRLMPENYSALEISALRRNVPDDVIVERLRAAYGIVQAAYRERFGL